MQIDFTDIPQVEDYRTVDPGEYHARVAEVRESTSPAGHQRWGLRWEGVRGDERERTICWDSLHFSERGLARAQFVLRVLGFDADGAVDLRPEQLLNRQALVTVAPEERTDPVTQTVRKQMRVPFTGYAPVPRPRPKGES